jgi:hypothetical protein
VVGALEVGVVRLGIDGPDRGQAGLLRRQQLERERVGDLPSHLALYRQDALQIALVAFGPELGLVPDLDQLGGDPHAVRLAPRATLQDICHVQITPDLIYRRVATLVAHHRRARDDAQAVRVEPAELGDHLLGDAVRQVLLLRVTGQVNERQYRHSDRLGPAGAAQKQLAHPCHVEQRQHCHDGRERRPGQPPAPAPRHGGSRGGEGGDATGLRRLERRLERRPHVGAVVEPLAGIFGQAALHHGPDRGRLLVGERRRCLVEDRRGQLVPGLARKRSPAAEHLVQHHPQRPDVRARICGLTTELLRSHVGDGADHRSGDGQRGAQLGRGLGHVPAGELFRQPEVEHLGAALGGHHHVGALQVAVHHAALVGVGQRVRHLGAQAHRLLDGQRAVGKDRVEGSALHQLCPERSKDLVASEPVAGRECHGSSRPIIAHA